MLYSFKAELDWRKTYFVAHFVLSCKDFETFFVPNFQVLQLEILQKNFESRTCTSRESFLYLWKQTNRTYATASDGFNIASVFAVLTTKGICAI